MPAYERSQLKNTPTTGQASSLLEAIRSWFPAPEPQSLESDVLGNQLNAMVSGQDLMGSPVSPEELKNQERDLMLNYALSTMVPGGGMARAPGLIPAAKSGASSIATNPKVSSITNNLRYRKPPVPSKSGKSTTMGTPRTVGNTLEQVSSGVGQAGRKVKGQAVNVLELAQRNSPGKILGTTAGVAGSYPLLEQLLPQLMDPMGSNAMYDRFQSEYEQGSEEEPQEFVRPTQGLDTQQISQNGMVNIPEQAYASDLEEDMEVQQATEEIQSTGKLFGMDIDKILDALQIAGAGMQGPEAFNQHMMQRAQLGQQAEESDFHRVREENRQNQIARQQEIQAFQGVTRHAENLGIPADLIVKIQNGSATPEEMELYQERLQAYFDAVTTPTGDPLMNMFDENGNFMLPPA